LGWRLLMTVFGPFCMAHSFVMAGEICSMRHTKDEHQRWWHVRHRLRPSRPTNEFFVFAVENGPPRKCSRFSGADRFSPCRLHAAIYEPIVYYLRIAGGIVKRATTIGRASRLGCWKIIHLDQTRSGSPPSHESGEQDANHTLLLIRWRKTASKRRREIIVPKHKVRTSDA